MNKTQIAKIQSQLDFTLNLLEKLQHHFEVCNKSPVTCDLSDLQRLQLLTESVKNLSQSLGVIRKDEHESR